MDKIQVKLSRGEKILLVLYELSGKSHKSIRYEDIVVAAYKKYPDDFHLKGYPEYPESGDLVHKPLYDYKKKGLVLAGNKMFALTEKGVVATEALAKAISGHQVVNTERVTRDIEKEVSRISKTTGFNLFVNGEHDSIVDTDFFDYLGTTVRTARNDFLGRLSTVSDVAKDIKGMKNPLYGKVIEYHVFMLKKFEDVISYKKEH
jgi:hypothetical protein